MGTLIYINGNTNWYKLFVRNLRLTKFENLHTLLQLSITVQQTSPKLSGFPIYNYFACEIEEGLGWVVVL